FYGGSAVSPPGKTGFARVEAPQPEPALCRIAICRLAEAALRLVKVCGHKLARAMQLPQGDGAGGIILSPGPKQPERLGSPLDAPPAIRSLEEEQGKRM